MGTRSATTLTDRTAARLAAAGNPLGVVISLQSEIAAALSRGLRLAAIWQQLHEEGVFRAGYDRFRRLVRQHVPQHPSAPRARAQRGVGQPSAAAPNANAPGGFAYNPTPKPDDLF
jgi:hypothetical protein